MDNINIQHKYEDELEKLQDDPEHYVTPGAKRYFQRVLVGYVVLAVAGIIGVWGVTERLDNKLRNDLNTAAVNACIGSIETFKKYNSLIDLQIQATREARDLNIRIGDLERAELNTDSIIRYQEAKLPVPTEDECRGRLLVKP